MVIVSNEKTKKLEEEIQAQKITNLVSPKMKNWLDLLPNEVLSHLLSFLMKSELLICMGGYDGESTVKVAEYLHETEWKSLPDMLTSRYRFNAVGIENIIYVLGGSERGANPIATMERFDFQSANWVPEEEINTARRCCVAAAVQVDDAQTILVSGGFNSEYEDLQTAELFNTRQGNWTMIANMRGKRYAHCSVTLADEVFVLGVFN